jgi:hypothetical protein
LDSNGNWLERVVRLPADSRESKKRKLTALSVCCDSSCPRGNSIYLRAEFIKSRAIRLGLGSQEQVYSADYRQQPKTHELA